MKLAKTVTIFQIKQALECDRCVKFRVEVVYGNRTIVPILFKYSADSETLHIDETMQNVTVPIVPRSCQ